MGRAESRLGGSPCAGGLPRAQAVVFACAALAIFLGVFGVSGWCFELAAARQLMPDFITIDPATASALVLAGASVAFAGLRRRRLSLAAGLLVAAIAIAKLSDVAFGSLPVDRVLFFGELADPVRNPSRMTSNAAVTVLLMGSALALLHARRQPARLMAQLFAIWIMLIAMFVLTGYGLNVVYLGGDLSLLPMAQASAFAILATGAGILTLSRETGIMLLLRDKGPAGAMFRLALPLVIAIPLVAGAIRVWGERQGYFGTESGIALQILCNVTVISTLLMVSTLALYRSDRIRREGEVALRHSERFNRLVAAANPDCILLLDEHYTVLFANEAVQRAFGSQSLSELIGRPFGHQLDPATQVERDTALRAAESGGVGRFTFSCLSRAGEIRWFDSIISRLPSEADSPFRYLAMSRDVTEKREIEDKVRWKAAHDDLTHLPNRAQFQLHLDRHVRCAGQEGFALLVLDIDNFKTVNDTLGHDAGDCLLRTVAERILRAVREGDVVARLAGDEFAVIARDVRTESGVVAVADRILDSLREPWLYHGRLGECRVSIGASLAPRHGDSADELFKHADIALYDAKSRGKGQIAVFRPSMKSAVEKRNRQISLARDALGRGFIIPYYQPKVELTTGRVAGFEALLRLRHPTQGVQMPGTIQAAFEDLELAAEITERMLGHVLLDMRRWLDRGVPFGHVAVNVTAADLRQDDFPDRLLAKLAAHELPHDCMQVEITETVFMGRGAEYVERALRMLHDAGVRVALDDFGTGYASLSHLKQFPVDIVKIDRSFLHDFALDPQNQAIINTVISLGHSLDIAIVAEGIETLEQERHLLIRGCTYGQGYLYGKAVPALRVPRLVTASRSELRTAA